MSVAGTATRQFVDATEIAALRRENDQLREALRSRAVIEQAKGALIWRFGVSDEAAFAVLRRWSQDTNVKLRTVAETLVTVVCRGESDRTRPTQLGDWLREQVDNRETMPSADDEAANERARDRP